MLTSVESSVDYSPCSVTNKSIDSSEWNDLEHLVKSPMFKSLTPNKSQSIDYNRQVPICNWFISDKNSGLQRYKQPEHEQIYDRILSLSPTQRNLDNQKIVNKAGTVLGFESNSGSEACINVNMGYNEMSSLESMASNKNPTALNNSNLSKNALEDFHTRPEKPPVSIISDSNINMTFSQPVALITTDHGQVKTFKSGSKVGHSRKWGSCGTAVVMQPNFDDKVTKNKISPELNHFDTVDLTSTSIAPSPPKTTEMRHKSFSQGNSLKRFSQLSLEAEFDSDGRAHEQITIDFRKFDPLTMSSQITQMELSYFKAIKPEEFLSFKWTGLYKHTSAPGIVASTRWFNQINLWAQRVILECSELNKRSEMLTYFIRVIKKLVENLNNLSSGMALMSALEVECIHRLKQTWNTLSGRERATFRRMEELFSSDNNYEKLREHINSLKLPCIPYLGLYLTDLTYINVAHSKLSEFESQTRTDQINNILRTVSEFQQSEYDAIQIPLLHRYLESQRYIEELQKFIEENNYRTSMLLEPNAVDSSLPPARQQQDRHTMNAISPQKTIPTYACKHTPNALQSPISPKSISSKLHNESINEVPEQQSDNQLMPFIDDYGKDASVNGDPDPTDGQQTVTSDQATSISIIDSSKARVYEDSLMMLSRYSDDDSVRMSMLCGTGRRSYLRKRLSNKSMRFKRNVTLSPRQQGSSKTATLSSTSQSVASDKELFGLHTKSLLDDSYLDATLSETCSGTAVVETVGQAACLGDISIVSGKQHEGMGSPPIFRCLIKGDIIDLKPTSSMKHKTEHSNFVNIALAAERASKCSDKEDLFHRNDSDISLTVSPNADHEEVMKLVCQGVLSKKWCLKNARRSRFSVWNRYWLVLLMSRNSAFLVFFENSQFRALERKDFKSKKCHVQDLKHVSVSRLRPSLNASSCREKADLSPSSDDGVPSPMLKKFFLVDEQYGAVYKFRDASVKSKSRRRDVVSMTDTENEHCLKTSPSSSQMPSLIVWYRSLKYCIRRINRPTEDNKDLIVLGDP